MTKEKQMKMKMKAITIPLICVTLFLAGCSNRLNGPKASEQGSTDEPIVAQKLILDDAETAEHKIPTTGGFISISDNEGRFDIVFTEGSVEKDKIFNVSPIKSIPNKNEEYLSTGFYLSENGSKDHVELKMPASICYSTDKELPANAMIVKYNEDGSEYSIIPTQRISIDGVNGLIAMVQSFSGYGVKTVTQEEIDQMGDELVKEGFDWVLKVDDEYTKEIPGVDAGEVNFTASLELSMENTEGKDSWTMHGPYKGDASLSVGVDISVEGQSFSSSFIGNVENESFTLYPVPKVYEATGDGLPLVGLVPEFYMGIGSLNFKWSHVQSENEGTDVVDIMGMFGASGDMADQTVTFTVITNGPYAEVTLVDFNMLGPMEYDGLIVGHGKDAQKEPDPIPLEDLAARYREKMEREAQVKSNSDGSVSLDKNGDGKNEITVSTTESGSFSYDMNGDGVEDFELAPLEVKK